MNPVVYLQRQSPRAAGVRDCHRGSEQLLAGPGPGFSCCRQPTASSPGRNLSRGEENVSENGDVRLKDGAGGEGFQGCLHRHIQGLGHAGSASGGRYGRTPGSGGVAQGRVYAQHTHSPGFHLQYRAHPQTVRRKNEILYPSGPVAVTSGLMSAFSPGSAHSDAHRSPGNFPSHRAAGHCRPG